jgi:D-alanyl-D-alanine carboxypeptidase
MNEAETILKNQVLNAETPSVQYLIFNRNEVIDHITYGNAGISKEIRIQENTTYNAFSITKTFTALAVMQLAEQELIGLELPAKKYLDNFPYHPDITIKQLLSHTAGIPNPVPLSWSHLADEHRNFESHKFFADIFKNHNRLISSPGQKFSYSNLGYVLLGWLIEQVSGLAYEEYIQYNIISKLKIRHQELGFRIEDVVKHATGYHEIMSFSYLLLGLLIDKNRYFDKREGKWKSFKPYYVNGAAYGGLIGTPQAFMIYLREFLNPASVLISQEYKRMLLTETKDGRNKSTGMCLSWFSCALNGCRCFTHAGGGGGYYCEIRIYPDQEIGSVIFYNRTGFKDERMLDKVDRFYLNR